MSDERRARGAGREEPEDRTDPGDREGIRAWVGDLLKAAGLEIQVSTFTERDALVIALEGADEELLLDNSGEGLEALQTIVGKIVSRRFGTTMRVLVDSKGLRIGREREIIALALATAEKVKAHGAPADLSPMNPHERRLVHLALSEDPAVTTESRGDGEIKRVTIAPAAKG